MNGGELDSLITAGASRLKSLKRLCFRLNLGLGTYTSGVSKLLFPRRLFLSISKTLRLPERFTNRATQTRYVTFYISATPSKSQYQIKYLDGRTLCWNMKWLGMCRSVPYKKGRVHIEVPAKQCGFHPIGL